MLNIFSPTVEKATKYKFDDDRFLAHAYTSIPTTEVFDVAQFFYHGDRIWTAITYSLDKKQGLKLYRGEMMMQILSFHKAVLKSRKEANTIFNPITQELNTTNLRIKSMATMVIEDDTVLRNGLQEGQAELNGKTVMVIDAREGEWRMFYSSTAGIVDSGDYLEATRESLKGRVPDERLVDNVLIESIKQNLKHRDDYIFHEYLRGNIRN